MKEVDHYKLLLHIKMSHKTTFYRGNRELILNRAKQYKTTKKD